MHPEQDDPFLEQGSTEAADEEGPEPFGALEEPGKMVPHGVSRPGRNLGAIIAGLLVAGLYVCWLLLALFKSTYYANEVMVVYLLAGGILTMAILGIGIGLKDWRRCARYNKPSGLAIPGVILNVVFLAAFVIGPWPWPLTALLREWVSF
jgi:hypothetical protein